MPACSRSRSHGRLEVPAPYSTRGSCLTSKNGAWAPSRAALAADCPRAGTLGTSRVLTVDPAVYPRVGLKSFPQTLPLQDKEVILTFDDGPAATTPRVLAALQNECVHATFFMALRQAFEDVFGALETPATAEDQTAS